MKRLTTAFFLAGLSACAAHPVTYQRQGDAFIYPVSDSQALAQCRAETVRDAHNYGDGSFNDEFWRAFDTPAMIRACMAGKGYAAVSN
jgi:hypothetical protein